jgi:hypothetical protein
MFWGQQANAPDQRVNVRDSPENRSTRRSPWQADFMAADFMAADELRS